jgi:DNA polymerase-1
MSIEKLILVDGNGIAYRCYFALPRLSSPAGIPTQAVYGFANVIFKVIDEEKPSYMGVAFDTKVPSFRHETYREYKAKRQEMPEEMSIQFPYIKRFLKALSIPILEYPGYEADDIIATLVERFKDKMEVLVISGDYDLLTLVGENVRVMLPRKGITETEVFDVKAVEEKLGVPPYKIPLFKTLAGDPSDNIKGIEGIGKVSAVEILKDVDSLDDLIEKIPKLPPKLRSKLEGKEDEIRKSFFVASLKRDIPISMELSQFVIKDVDKEELKAIALELGMRSILKRFSLENSVQDTKVSYEKVDKEKLISLVDNVDYLSLDGVIESSYYPPLLRELVVCIDGHLYRIENGQKEFIEYLFSRDKTISLYDVKSIYKCIGLEKKGYSTRNILDISLLAYLLDPSQDIKVENLIDKYLGKPLERPLAISQLGPILREEVSKNEMGELYERIELPLARVLADMELKGVLLDTEYLGELSKILEVSLSQIEGSIYNLAGETFNINSPKQLAYILFEKLKLPPIKKTKTGYSTDAEVLAQLANESEICARLLEYRELTKLKSTYVDALPKLVNPYTKRLHTTFTQVGTSTGRLASMEPNLQNIPIRSEIGKEIRKAFIAPPGYKLISADYSQIELRILAHLSGDPILIEAFERGIDIHSQTASKLFGVRPEEVTPNMRRMAKTINFGIIYGMSDYGLSKELGIHKREAASYIENYFNTYKVVKEFLDGLKREALEKGYVRTMFNRRRYIPQLKSNNKTERELGERLAVNTPIQGSAADLIKLAMVNLYDILKVKGLDASIILQIHDELLVEVKEDEAEEVADIVKEAMETVYPMKVPITVELGIGDNWCEI